MLHDPPERAARGGHGGQGSQATVQYVRRYKPTLQGSEIVLGVVTFNGITLYSPQLGLKPPSQRPVYRFSSFPRFSAIPLNSTLCTHCLSLNPVSAAPPTQLSSTFQLYIISPPKTTTTATTDIPSPHPPSASSSPLAQSPTKLGQLFPSNRLHHRRVAFAGNRHYLKSAAAVVTIHCPHILSFPHNPELPLHTEV